MAITWLDCNCRTLSIYAKRGDETRPEERETERERERGRGMSAGRRETVQSAIEPFAFAFASVSRYVFHGSIMIDSCDSWFMAWLPEIPSTSQTLFIWIMIRAITISLETEARLGRTCYVAYNWHADVTGNEREAPSDDALASCRVELARLCVYKQSEARRRSDERWLFIRDRSSASMTARSSHCSSEIDAVCEESRASNPDGIGKAISRHVVSCTRKGSRSRAADYRAINEWDSRHDERVHGCTERPPRDLIAIGEFWMAIEIESGVNKIRRASRVECPWQDFLESDRAQSSTQCVKFHVESSYINVGWLKSFPLSAAVLLVASPLAWRALAMF